MTDVRLVILDRDGTLVEAVSEGDYLINPDAVVIVPLVAERVRQWNESGVTVVVATNQRCVSLGLATMAEVDEVNQRITEHLTTYGAHIDRWYMCPHGHGECSCRKPQPGLLLNAMRDADVTSEHALMIGDRESDQLAAQAAGVPFMWVQELS